MFFVHGVEEQRQNRLQSAYSVPSWHLPTMIKEITMSVVNVLFPGLAALPNLHPVLVHFPIAFFVGALLMEAMAIFRHERFHWVATWMCYLATLTAVATLFSGFAAEHSIAVADPMGHHGPTHHFIHIHRSFMIVAVTVALFFTTYLFMVNLRQTWHKQRWGIFMGLVIVCALISLGADRGSRLVFEFGIGVNPTLRNVAPTAETHHPENDHDKEEAHGHPESSP